MDLRRCFISAEYGAEITALQRVLDQNGVNWQWAKGISSRISLLDSVVEAIAKSDFVVGIFSAEIPSANVMLELGIAIGHRIPLLLFATGKNRIPFDLSGFSIFDTDLKNDDLLSLQVDLFLRSLDTETPVKRSSAAGLSSGSSSSKRQSAPGLFHSALEESIASAIHRAGGRVTLPSRLKGVDITPDLLMWLPQQDKELFNPAALEVKQRIRKDELPGLQIKLAEFVRKSGMGCGLIIVNSIHTEREIPNLMPIPYTFLIGLREFNSKLERAELGSWLKRERNRLAHGVR